MIEISNLRKRTAGDETRLEADINFFDIASPYSEKTLYFEIDKKYGHMLADDSYDAFVLVPLWLAMLHKQDLHIRGQISKKLYQNIKWYVQKIFCDFYDELSPVKLTVEGFTDLPKKRGKIIGTGISCGVDSLSTIYDHFLQENDSDYRINALFYFNCAARNDFGNKQWEELVLKRYEPGKLVAKELGLPCYYLNTNLHAFRKKQDWTKVHYIAIYSCIFSLSRAISRYYIPNALDYEQKKIFPRHDDMAAFCDTYLVPLIQNERTELIIDGGQYRRVDKIKNIVDWNIAQKYLNVCNKYTVDGSNCGVCEKCRMTLLPLEIMGKLDAYSNVFDLDKYRASAQDYKLRCIDRYSKDVFAMESVDFAKENNFPLLTSDK